ncbi:ATP-binding cassette domain-containing protein [Mumia sp. zg.B21]|uniref:ABC transporter ATP-binding protein n=1 Tax=Mumia sp. zg.B21 TaxID=2855447 RepID=UPI001C6EA4E6|nr:ATP-binding cassette domain-containing protein [Mumia sp. zg.B21]MBW9210200.1 ATP-binding cassette domain-containing protein [Mumia sp. zg.B21]
MALRGSTVLRDVSLGVAAGEVVAVSGASGSGKSTLLNVLSGLLVPDAGEVTVNGVRIDTLSDRRRAAIRLRSFGIAFQAGDLIPELSVGENVALPLRLLGTRRSEARARAIAQLDNLGIADLYDSDLGAVSGGQAQRAALARALVHRPIILLADEPTGALDDANAGRAVEQVIDVARDGGLAAVVVTHDARVAERCDRVLHLRAGVLTDATLAS